MDEKSSIWILVTPGSSMFVGGVVQYCFASDADRTLRSVIGRCGGHFGVPVVALGLCIGRRKATANDEIETKLNLGA